MTFKLAGIKSMLDFLREIQGTNQETRGKAY